METTESLYTWRGLLYLCLLLLVCYWLLKLVTYTIQKLGKKNLSNKHITNTLKKILLVFKPLAIILLLLNFISINYITHSLLLVAISVFGYRHIKNYINGIVFKINPLVSKNASIDIHNSKGIIKSLLPFGVIISTETGEQYLDYNSIEKYGFSIKSNLENTLRQTLFLKTDYTKDEILDFLFDNPILAFNEKPDLNTKEGNYKLQYSLEKGANSEDLVAFLEEKNIKTSTTNII